MEQIKRNFKICLEYDGSNFWGWQRQAKDLTGRLLTIQSNVEKALSLVCQENIVVHASGRTDAGVHAKGQVAHFFTKSIRSTEEIVRGANSLLPKSIAIISAKEVSSDFHARFSAKTKTYSYQFSIAKVRSPLLNKRAWWVGDNINWPVIAKALPYLIGEKDFSSFRSQGSDLKSTVRKINQVYLQSIDSMLLKCLVINGNGFLRHMIRAICGTLILIGRGRLSSFDLFTIIEARDRQKAGANAPACGLYLEEVFY